MNKPNRKDAILVGMAVGKIKEGIISGIQITGNNPFLHMSAVTMAVSHYLDAYSETFHVNLEQTVDDFIEGVKTLMKESDPNVS